MKKLKFLPILTILISLLLINFINHLSTDVRAGDSWMNSSWAYRKGVEVANSTGGDLTNEDVLIEIDTAALITASKMQNDCDDLRFTDSDKTTAIDYWIESGCNTSTTQVWIRIPSLPSAGKTVYFYYGNDTAVNAETRWPIYLSFGTGVDGSCTVSSGLDINTGSCVGRANGDAVNFSVTTNVSSGSGSITLSSTPTGLTTGDEILIINLQGTSTNYSNLGKYELVSIASIDTNTLTLDTNLVNGYDGTTQKIMVQRVPHYTNVTINSGQSFYPSTWDGTKGGVLVFKANGTLTVTGTISATGKGYRAGAGTASSSHYGGQEGEGAARTSATSGNGGNANPGTAGVAGLWSGGGGGGKQGGIGGQAGGAGTTNVTSSGGGGGGSVTRYNALYHGYGGDGGGGGHATGGIGGNGGSELFKGSDGSTSASGAGHSAGREANNNRGGGGGGGSARYGSPTLSILTMGGGGGGGGVGQWRETDASYNPGGDGGNGGGIVYISAGTITVTGSIQSKGIDGVNEDRGGSGGGGAGGAVKLYANTVTIGTTLITATGGPGDAYGTGGTGRIRAEYITSLSGTSSPSASTSQLTLQSVTIQSEEDYNQTPTAPTVPYTEGSSNPTQVSDITPEFSAIFNDPDTGDTSEYYEIEVNVASDFTDTVMWDSGKTSMTSTTEGDRSPNLSYAGTSLSQNGNTYYWRIKFWDTADAESPWASTAQFTMNTAPTDPTDLLTESSTNPTNVSDLTPEFSAIFNDPDTDDTSAYYEIEVNTNSGFTGAVMWDSGKTAMTSTAQGLRSPDIPYAGTSLAEDGITYYWRIKFWDSKDVESSWSFTAQFVIDNAAPTGSIVIAGEDEYRTTTSTTLTLSATDETSGIYQMIICNNSGFTDCNWEAYSTSKAWTLLSGDGLKTVYVKYIDNATHESITCNNTITLDTTDPTGTVAFDPGNTYTTVSNIVLDLFASDETSGIDQMIVCNNSEFTDCTWEVYATPKNWNLLSGDGLKIVYLKYIDNATNESISYNDTIILDTTAPTGTISINSGASSTEDTNVTLTLSATDTTSGINQMMICNSSSFIGCTWETYATSKNWLLTSGDGTKTVYIKYNDNAGLISSVINDTISFAIPIVTPTPVASTPPTETEEEEEEIPGEIVVEEEITEEEIAEVIEILEELEDEGEEINQEEDVTITVGELEIDTKGTEVIHVYQDSDLEISIPVDTLISEDSDIDNVYAVLAGDVIKLTLNPVGDQYIGTLTSRNLTGEQSIDILTMFKDSSTKKSILNISIDPYGYVYSLGKGNNQLRIENATVSLYRVVEGERTLYVVSGQDNPQKTDVEGQYSFMVEPGIYILVVKADGYKDYDSGEFEVEKTIVEMNIELEEKFNIFDYWFYMLTGLVIIPIFAVLVKKTK